MSEAKIVVTAEDKASRILREIRGELTNMQGGVQALRGALGAVAPVFAGAFSAAAVLGFVKATNDGIDALNDLKAATGSSISNLSAIEDIAVRTGTSFETAGAGLVKFNKILSDAADPGSQAAAQIKALGLSVQELQKLDPAIAFQKMAIALRGFADDGEKGRFMVEMFGRQTKATAKFMEDLADAGKLVGTRTDADAEAANKFNNELAAIGKAATDVARDLTGPMVSAINETIEKFREGKRAGRGFWDTLLEGPKRVFGVATGQLPLSALVDQIAPGGASGSWDAPKPSLPAAVVADKPKAARIKAEREGIQGLLLDRQEAFRASELAAQASANEALRVDVLTGAERSRADALREVADRQQELNALLGATPTGQLQEAQRQVALIVEAFNAGSISDVQQYVEALQAITGKLGGDLKKTADEISAFTDQAARNIQDALGNTVEATLRGNFDNIADLWKNLLVRMASQAAAAQLGQELLGDFAKSGQIGGSIGSLLALLPAFASGTDYVPRDMVALIHKGEKITPANENRPGAGGGLTLVQNLTNNIDARTDQAAVAQSIAAGVREGNRQMLEHLRVVGAT